MNDNLIGLSLGMPHADQLRYAQKCRRIRAAERKAMKDPQFRLRGLENFLTTHLKKDPDTYGDHRTNCTFTPAQRRARWEEIKVKVEQTIEKTKKEVEESHVQQ